MFVHMYVLGRVGGSAIPPVMSQLGLGLLGTAGVRKTARMLIDRWIGLGESVERRPVELSTPSYLAKYTSWLMGADPDHGWVG